LLIVVAILEEVVFRGLLVQVCLELPDTALIVAVLSGSLVMFSLSHLSFGWPHVVGKFPLGVVTLVGTLALGTVLPAIIAHVMFNSQVWRDRTHQPVFSGIV
jgi:membrane protease YdiL (CAAX protease family)